MNRPLIAPIIPSKLDECLSETVVKTLVEKEDRGAKGRKKERKKRETSVERVEREKAREK